VPIVDLTRPFWGHKAELVLYPLKSDRTEYTGMVYNYSFNSMDSTYLDLPGHIRETDDGVTAENYDPAAWYRVPCRVVHLHRQDNSGGVSASDLEAACGGKISTPALILNGLEGRNAWEMTKRSVFLEMDAVEWIVDCGVKLLISDIYESTRLDGVFLRLFEKGVATVCEPANIYRLPCKECRITVAATALPTPQIPCRLIAEY